MARIVLVADDSPTIQKKAMGILKDEGFDVETVSNGVAAIKRVAVLHPLVILADVSMPGRDGYEVCEYVKKSPELRHTAVLLVASDMEPYDHVRGAEVGADGIIKKPFDPHELASTVAKFADQFEAETAATTSTESPASNEPPQEFAAAGEYPDYTPPVLPGAPDFSTSPDGVALFEPEVEHSEFASEPGHSEMGQFFAETPTIAPDAIPDSTGPTHNPFFDETPVPLDELPAPAAVEPEPASHGSTFFETVGDAAHAPVFADGPAEQDVEPSASSSDAHTVILSTPSEIPDFPWSEPSVPAAASSEPDSSATAEATAPDVALEPPAEPPIDAPQPTETITATSLDGFSLDDAASGRVQFASEAGEVVIQPPDFASHDELPAASNASAPDPSAAFLDELPAAPFGQEEPSEFAAPRTGEVDAVSMEPPPAAAPFDELATAFFHAPEPAPESTSIPASEAEIAAPSDEPAALGHSEPHSEEGAAAAALAEPAAPETTTGEFTPEAMPLESTAPAALPELIEPAHASLAIGEVLAAVEAASIEPFSGGTDTAQPAAVEGVPEPLPASQDAEPAPVPAGEPASGDAAGYGFVAEAAPAEGSPSGAVPTEVETVAPEAAAAQNESPAAEPPATASAAAEPAPTPACDLELVHSIVRKVAAKMAPPVLSPEALEEITSRLTNEIAAELAPPPARE